MMDRFLEIFIALLTCVRPISIFALTGACTLLICGAVSDRVGSRRTLVLGCLLQTLACIACGLSRTGPQIIASRGVSGFATSLCMPSATSIIYEEFLPGKRRNIALALMGGGQPVGFALGITLGGLLATSLGWQWGFHIAAVVCVVIAIAVASQSAKTKPISYHGLFF
jgi:MFS family permease